MEAILLPPEKYRDLADGIADEVYEAFCWYMNHENHGRPVILAGFSQGALLVKEILKRMTEEQYSHLVAAYVLGWGVNKNDLKHPHIKPAQSEDDRSVTICYNTVSSADGIWNFVQDSSACCINPVNWCTDSTPADFEYHGQTLQVSVDTVLNVLMVKGFKKEPLPFTAPWPDNCLHHYEPLFFARQIGANARHRSRAL